MSEEQSVEIVLTPEQREKIRRASGQDIEAIEVLTQALKESTAPVKLRWRLSQASGIPRLDWQAADIVAKPR